MGILLPDLSYSLPYIIIVEKNHCFFTSVGLTHTRLTYVILELERLCSRRLLGSGSMRTESSQQG